MGDTRGSKGRERKNRGENEDKCSIMEQPHPEQKQTVKPELSKQQQDKNGSEGVAVIYSKINKKGRQTAAAT